MTLRPLALTQDCVYCHLWGVLPCPFLRRAVGQGWRVAVTSKHWAEGCMNLFLV